MKSTSAREPKWLLLGYLVPVTAIVVSAFLSSGCRSVADFHAAKMPMELREQGKESGQIDLSMIASKSINSDMIYAGDVLDVTVSSGLNDSSNQPISVRVNEEGKVKIPLMGDVQIGGLALTAAEEAIRNASIARQIYRNPHVAVVPRQRKTIAVRVVGAVQQPGVYDLPAAGSDLLAAVVAAGGLSKEAGTIVELRNPNGSQHSDGQVGTGIRLASFEPSLPSRTVQVDLREVNLPNAPRLEVENGSVISVLAKEKHSISILGLVHRPGNYELPTDESLRLLDALALAGDRQFSFADRVRVIRRRPGEESPASIQASIRKAKKVGEENLLIAPGDTIVVEETPTTIVLSTVRGFLRFGFSSAIPGL